MSWFHRVGERVKSWRAGRPRTAYSISHDMEALQLSWLTIENESGSLWVRWRDVLSVCCYKKDLWIVDLVCAEVVLDGKRVITLHEEMEGWESLVQSLPKYLPRCRPASQWWSQVALPPFAASPTVIYEREG